METLQKKIALPLDWKLMFLIQAMIAAGVHDLYTGRADLVPICGLPVVCYIVGLYIGRIRVRGQNIGILAAGLLLTFASSIKGLVELQKTNQTEFKGTGLYLDISTGNMVDKSLMIFDFALLACLIASLLLWALGKMKPAGKPWLTWLEIALLALIVAFIFRHDIRDGRLAAIKEAIKLIWDNPWGGFTVTALGINTSHDMYLDYARDYGCVVFYTLVIFQLLQILDWIRLVFVYKLKSLESFFLGLSLAFLTCFYLLESTAMQYRYMWYAGLILAGMTRTFIEKNKEEQKEKLEA